LTNKNPYSPSNKLLDNFIVCVALFFTIERREFYAASRATKTIKAQVPKNTLTKKLRTTDLTGGMMDKTLLDWAAL